MDKDTAVEIMRGDWSKLKVRDIRKTYIEIADFIEEQDRELTKLREQRKEEIKMRLLAAKMKKGEIVISPDSIVFKDTAEDIERRMKECDKWEQYADLGQLVTKYPDGICNSTQYDEKWSSCRQCRSLKACQKRAELLVKEVPHES